MTKIKAIAVDMDGTFLNSKNDYDRKEFTSVFRKLKENKVKFIVASGNQYAQLRSFFPEFSEEITFVSENGALVFNNNFLVKKHIIEKNVIQEYIQLLQSTNYGVGIILCGVNSAYILKNQTESFKNNAAKYYFELKEVDSFDDLPAKEEWVKIALHLDDKFAPNLLELLGDNNPKLKAVYSGHGSVDLIAETVNKGNTLKEILKEWNINPEELLAFGDSNNDLEMLDLAGYSYVMSNGTTQAREIAKYIAPSNDDNGVISIIKKLFEF